ncbi:MULTISPECIES: phosphatase PAP2 family protein [unclassified Streptomyces]|uniref:phosphatase PAP2 family protein n=1 Tax=unclassified Streptomyces TaxID=2593676 RepID=UPI00068E0705|nr:phosphatase PAP2 family protein [Streptomyces sp. NRRL F-2747]
MSAPAAPRATRWGLTAALCAALFAVLTALVAARHGSPYPLDASVHRWAVRHRPAVAVALARGVTATGTGPVPYLCAVVAGLVAGRGRGSRGRLLTAAGALGFLLLAQGLRYAVLYGVARPRPPVADRVTHASGFSFPSGHTSTSALVAGLLAWAVWRAASPAAARLCRALFACWAVTVGLTRVYLGVHWPTDVLGGWLYALTWLSAAMTVDAGFGRGRVAGGGQLAGGYPAGSAISAVATVRKPRRA